MQASPALNAEEQLLVSEQSRQQRQQGNGDGLVIDFKESPRLSDMVAQTFTPSSTTRVFDQRFPATQVCWIIALCTHGSSPTAVGI